MVASSMSQAGDVITSTHHPAIGQNSTHDNTVTDEVAIISVCICTSEYLSICIVTESQ